MNRDDQLALALVLTIGSVAALTGYAVGGEAAGHAVGAARGPALAALPTVAPSATPLPRFFAPVSTPAPVPPSASVLLDPCQQLLRSWYCAPLVAAYGGH